MNEIKLKDLNKIWTNLKSQFYHFSQNKNYIYIYIYIYIWKLKEGKEESDSGVFTSNSWRLYYILFLLNNWRKNIPPAYGSLAEKTWCLMGGMRSVVTVTKTTPHNHPHLNNCKYICKISHDHKISLNKLYIKGFEKYFESCTLLD